MELIKEINLNINQANQFELINVMQGSIHSVRVIAHLFDGNQPYQIPDTVSKYQLLGALPSGKYLLDDKVSKYDACSVSFLINKNMMAKAGYVQFTISLVETDDTAIVETFPAKIMVTAIPGQEYQQTDEIPIVTESLQDVIKNRNLAVQAAEKSQEYYQKLLSEKAQPDGIATLDEKGKLPLSQLSAPNEIWSQTEPSEQEQRTEDYWIFSYGTEIHL